MAADIYVDKLRSVVSALEVLYGLDKISPSGCSYQHCDVRDVIKYETEVLKNMPDKQRYEINTSAGRQTVLLAYLNHRLKFFNKAKLDYSLFPRLDEIARILMFYLNRDEITEDNIRALNKIVTIMDALDEKFIRGKSGLGYKFLRVFVIMIMYGNYCNAGVVADFIIKQIMLGVKNDR